MRNITITTISENSYTITLTLDDGQVKVWEHFTGDDVVEVIEAFYGPEEDYSE